MRRRPSLALLALGAAVAVGACSSDLFHTTEWANLCDQDPNSAGCPGGATTAATTGAGGSGGGVGGGGGAGGGVGGGTTVAGACAEFAQGLCEALLRCRPVTTPATFGSAGACAAIWGEQCERGWFGPGSVRTPDQLLECADAIGFADVACGELLRFSNGQSPIAECRIPGMLPNGDPCVAGAQCVGGACVVPPDVACGACSTPNILGGMCAVDTDCEAGLRCAAGTCAALADVGAACTADPECYIDLHCAAGFCAPRLKAGEVCDASIDCEPDTICNMMTLVCEAVSTVPLAAPCGNTPAGGLAICESGSACSMAGMPAGTCVARVDEGAACTFDGPLGSECRSPARCIALECTVLDAAACAP